CGGARVTGSSGSSGSNTCRHWPRSSMLLGGLSPAILHPYVRPVFVVDREPLDRPGWSAGRDVELKDHPLAVLLEPALPLLRFELIERNGLSGPERIDVSRVIPDRARHRERRALVEAHAPPDPPGVVSVRRQQRRLP